MCHPRSRTQACHWSMGGRQYICGPFVHLSSFVFFFSLPLYLYLYLPPSLHVHKYMNHKKGSGLLHLSNVHQWVNDWSLNGDGTGNWWRVNYLYSICLRRGGSHQNAADETEWWEDTIICRPPFSTNNRMLTRGALVDVAWLNNLYQICLMSSKHICVEFTKCSPFSIGVELVIQIVGWLVLV